MVTALFLASICVGAAGEGVFLRSHRDLDADFQSAMASVMGCGKSVPEAPQEHADNIKSIVTPTWATLPKNPRGKVDWRTVRSVAHRFFMQQYNLLVIGLEPSSSASGSVDIMSGRGESILDAVLKGEVNGEGFTLDDITLLLATLERVIVDSEAKRLETSYQELKYSLSDSLSHAEVVSVISTYLDIWMSDDDEDAELLAPRARRHWRWKEFATWVAKKMEYDASRTLRIANGRSAMHLSYSFEQVHQAVGYITKNAASYWESDCRVIKSALVRMDTSGTGRILLSDFHGAKTDGQVWFTESEAYLRELGALDESSTLTGTHVIIPNYLQSASNCVAHTKYYMVCCASECDEVLNDIEGAVGVPHASVETILGIVQNMSSFDDEPPRLEGNLMGQLQRIAQLHGGQVLLHGRLFALWLHYVFPRECPYPRRYGEFVATPSHKFSGAFASGEELESNSARRNSTKQRISDVERAQWMDAWNVDEKAGELGVDLGAAPWDRAGNWLRYLCGAATMLGVAWPVTTSAIKLMTASGHVSVSSESKATFV